MTPPSIKPSPAEIRARLGERFPDADIGVQDDSHLHAGHAGARGGAGHFTVTIRSAQFRGLTRVAQHRLVYDALADWIPTRIHALAVKSSTTDQTGQHGG